MSKWLELRPITLRAANDWLDGVHRHNGRTTRNAGKFAIAVIDGMDAVVGVAIVGRPVSATYEDGVTAEVLRVCTQDEAPTNVCSMLYAACWRAWKAMGGRRLITYTLQTEPGTSLTAAGWKIVGTTEPTRPGWRKQVKPERIYQPVMMERKNRWEPLW